MTEGDWEWCEKDLRAWLSVLYMPGVPPWSIADIDMINGISILKTPVSIWFGRNRFDIYPISICREEVSIWA
jgi:hypothetical protein